VVPEAEPTSQTQPATTAESTIGGTPASTTPAGPPTVVQLTDTGARNGQAVFSPDGTQIAHVSDLSGEWEAWITAADGSSTRQATDGIGPVGWPTWSYDGSWLWLYAPTGDGWGIFAVDIDDGLPVPLATTVDLVDDEVWTGDLFRPLSDPSGQRILFDAAVAGTDHDLYVLDIAAGTTRRATTDPGYDSDARWSPDGTRIAFHSDRGEGGLHTQVFVLDLDGGEVTQLTRGDAVNGYPAWSPDGNSIVFTSEAAGNRDVWLMDADGSNQRRVTVDAGFDGDPVFTPDGTQVLFTTDRFGGRELALVTLDD